MKYELITSYMEESFKSIEIRRTLYKAILFFLKCALMAKTLVPTKVGQKTRSALPRNGTKRVYRLFINKYFTRAFMDDIYLILMKKLIPKNKPLILAIDWTIIKEKFCFLSISWVLSNGRSIPLYFTGYQKLMLDIYASQSSIEKKTVQMILDMFPNKKDITILADRGFDSPDLLDIFIRNKIKFVVRSKTERYIYLKNGKEIKLTHELIKKGSEKKYINVFYTKTNPVLLSVYLKWDKNQDEGWILLSNISNNVSYVADLYAKRWEIEEMFKSMKNQDVGFDLKTVKLRHIDRWLRLLFIATILFQFIGLLGLKTREIHNIEKRYSLSSKPPKDQKYIYSIYSLAILVLEDFRLDLKIKNGKYFIKYPDSKWIQLS